MQAHHIDKNCKLHRHDCLWVAKPQAGVKKKMKDQPQRQAAVGSQAVDCSPQLAS